MLDTYLNVKVEDGLAAVFETVMYSSWPGIFAARWCRVYRAADRRKVAGGASGSRSGRVETRGVPVTPARPHRAFLRNYQSDGCSGPEGTAAGVKSVRSPRTTNEQRRTTNASHSRSVSTRCRCSPTVTP